VGRPIDAGTSEAGRGAPAGTGAQSPRDAGTTPPTDARVADSGATDSGALPRDAGAAGDSAAPTADSGAGDASAQDAQVGLGAPVIVAVGYQGLRVMSKDRGRTWEHKIAVPYDGSSDLDNPLLLRTVTYGKGLFVAAGHHIYTSPDGVEWTERDNPQSQWFGGVQWGNDRFVAAGGYGETWYSVDGITWMAGGKRGNNSHARTLAFGNGEFRCATDDGDWWSSTTGETWSHVGDGHSNQIAFCDGAFRDAEQYDCGDAFGHDVYLRGGDWNQNVIRYSDDGDEWHDVRVEYVGSLRGFAFGYD
jgi:hypothetical protein